MAGTRREGRRRRRTRARAPGLDPRAREARRGRGRRRRLFFVAGARQRLGLAAFRARAGRARSGGTAGTWGPNTGSRRRPRAGAREGGGGGGGGVRGGVPALRGGVGALAREHRAVERPGARPGARGDDGADAPDAPDPVRDHPRGEGQGEPPPRRRRQARLHPRLRVGLVVQDAPLLVRELERGAGLAILIAPPKDDRQRDVHRRREGVVPQRRELPRGELVLGVRPRRTRVARRGRRHRAAPKGRGDRARGALDHDSVEVPAT